MVMRYLYKRFCIVLLAARYKHLGFIDCEPNSPCSARCLFFKCTYSGVEAITRLLEGVRLFFYAICSEMLSAQTNLFCWLTCSAH
jgi:hypothetical protein